MTECDKKNIDPLHYLKEKGYNIGPLYHPADKSNAEDFHIISNNGTSLGIYLKNSQRIKIKVNVELINEGDIKKYMSFFELLKSKEIPYSINKTKKDIQNQENIMRQIRKNKQ